MSLQQQLQQAGLAIDDPHAALAQAAEKGSTSLVRLLAGCIDVDINRPEHRGYSALMLACRAGHVDTARALIATQGCAINQARSSTGGTALILAAQEGHCECVRALLGVAGKHAHPSVYTCDLSSLPVLPALPALSALPFKE